MGFGGFGSPQWRLAQRLRNESVVVVFEDRPLVTLDSRGSSLAFLRVVANPDLESKAFQEVLDELQHDEDRELWINWLRGYRAPDDLLQRATAVVHRADAAEASNLAQVAAVRRIDKFSYPLTVLGMALAVLASGHLLKSVPSRLREDAPEASKQMRATILSATLVLFLSALDLAWTILAAQAGQMRELNPLGDGLIDDPYRLIAFKSSATLLSCGLLIALRHHHIARLAAWWLCLVCTILTFRWLAFNSMFLGS
jgi:hypothetical protein